MLFYLAVNPLEDTKLSLIRELTSGLSNLTTIAKSLIVSQL